MEKRKISYIGQRLAMKKLLKETEEEIVLTTKIITEKQKVIKKLEETLQQENNLTKKTRNTNEIKKELKKIHEETRRQQRWRDTMLASIPLYQQLVDNYDTRKMMKQEKRQPEPENGIIRDEIIYITSDSELENDEQTLTVLEQVIAESENTQKKPAKAIQSTAMKPTQAIQSTAMKPT